MAKIPKFNLTMDGELVRSIEELQNNFSVDDILNHFESKRLHKWLKSRGFTDYLTKVEAIDYDDKTAIIKPLMDIFEIDYSDEDLSDILDQLKYVPTTASHTALVPVSTAQADSDKFPVAPLSKEVSGSVNLDYESQKYEELVNEIINDPENLELIKKNIDLLASKYYAFYSRDALYLFYKFSEDSHLALFAILDNPKAIKPYIPFFGFMYKFTRYYLGLRFPLELLDQFKETAEKVFCASNLAENYKLFSHIKKAVDCCKTTSFALVLFSSNFTQKGDSSLINLYIYRELDGEKHYSDESLIYYVDLADYGLPQEDINAFYQKIDGL